MLKNIKKRLKDQRGLTLIELLAVVVILGIIAAIAVPSIGNIIDKSKYDAARAEALQALDAARLYVASVGEKETIPHTDLETFLEETKHWESFDVTFDDASGEYEFSGEPNTDTFKMGANTIEGTKREIDELTYEKE